MFSGCKKLKTIRLPAGITSIGDYTFYECGSLSEIELPEGLEKIGENAFDECKKLKKIVIPESVTEIGEFAFSDCENLTEITIPEGVDKIENCLLRNCGKLKKVKMPAKVSEWGEGVLKNCDELTEISLPEGVKEIDDYSFMRNEKLKTVRLPGSIKRIGENAFDGCTSLKTINIPEGAELGTCAFGACESLEEIQLPESLTEIPDYLFCKCSKLKKVRIPESVEKIGEFAFSDCSSLISVNIPDGITEIPDYAFEGCINLKQVALPDNIEKIGDSAFKGCEKLTEIIFPDVLKTIGNNAFDGCKGLTELEIPDSVESIGNWAFDDCDGLKSISMPGHPVELGGWALPSEDEVKITYRAAGGRKTTRKPVAKKPAAEGPAGPVVSGRFSVITPDDEIYTHYGKLKREADKFKGMGVRYVQNNGREHEAIPLTGLMERQGNTNNAIYKKLKAIEAKDRYDLKDTALKIAQVFRVDKDVFNARHDDEGDIGVTMLDKKWKFSALRSFAWTLADLADREGKGIDDYGIDDLLEICRFIEEREWLNYEAGSWFDGLCGHPDIHVYYMPETMIADGSADGICDLFNYNPIVSLDAFRNDLAQLKNPMILLHNRLLENRDRSVKLESAEAAVLNAWCSMVVSAETSFFSEDGPMMFFHDYPDTPPNTKPLATGPKAAGLKKAAAKAKKEEPSAAMNSAGSYEIVKGPDGKERIKLGEYPVGEPIVWLVLEHKGNELLLLSEYGLDAKAFSEGFGVEHPSEWKECTLRTWLNEDFYEEAFDETEQGMILDDTHNTYKKSNEGEEETGFVTDKVFLLSARELKQYLPTQREMICKATAFAKSQGAEIAAGPDQCGWWLRSPAVQMMGLSGWAGSVQADGSAKGWGYGASELCARPVIRVKSDKFKFSSTTPAASQAPVSPVQSMTKEEQEAINTVKELTEKMSDDLNSTKSALEKHAENLRRQEEEKEKRMAEAKARGKSDKDEADMLAVLQIEEAIGKLNRPDEEFAEVYAEDFGAYTPAQLNKLRKKVKPKMHDAAFIESVKEEMLSRPVKDRFSISTGNWFNLGNDWNFDTKGEMAIAKSRQYYRDNEMAEVRNLMEEHKKAGIDSVNRQLTAFNAGWNSFAGVRNDLHINIEAFSEQIPEKHNLFDVMIDRGNHVQILLKHPSMGFLTIPVMNLFASVWKTTPQAIWDAALNNSMDDARGTSLSQTRADAARAKGLALAPLNKSASAPVPQTKPQAVSAPKPTPAAGAASQPSPKQERKTALEQRIRSLKHELSQVTGIFGFMKRKRLEKEIMEAERELRMMQ